MPATPLSSAEQAVAAQNQLNFSRDMEREADRVGFGVMTDAGFESRGMTAMFEKLQQASRLNDNGAFPYLRSHPLTTERIAAARARVQLSSTEAAKPSREKEIESGTARVLHAMMASRARILAAPGVDACCAPWRQRPSATPARLPPCSRCPRPTMCVMPGCCTAVLLRRPGCAISPRRKVCWNDCSRSPRVRRMPPAQQSCWLLKLTCLPAWCPRQRHLPTLQGPHHAQRCCCSPSR
jgi:hypothetical protein